jgi:TLD
LYSYEFHGKSFNRLEFALLGYAGPTVLVAQTTGGATLGAYTASGWKDSRHFIGTTDSFVFSLGPEVRVHKATADGGGKNYMFLHSDAFHGPIEPSDDHTTPHGIGFGGSMQKPRLFIPTSFEHCSADFLDMTYAAGLLLPNGALEQFELRHLEIWGVGGEETIQHALQKRAEHRDHTDTAILRARIVHDKMIFAKDLESGLIPNQAFAHTEQVRGRHDYIVDEEHGGYKIE